MKDVLFVLEALFMMFLLSKRLLAHILWMISVMMFHMSYEYGNVDNYREVIKDYPEEDCLKFEKYSFLFKNLENINEKGIPKEMFLCEKLKFSGFVLYSLLWIPTYLIDENLSIACGVIHVIFYMAITVFCFFFVKTKSFKAKYKKINQHNIKYYLSPNDEPLPVVVGKCRIIKVNKKGKRKIAIVKLIDTREIKVNVEVQCQFQMNDTTEYTLYEICKVLYIA